PGIASDWHDTMASEEDDAGTTGGARLPEGAHDSLFVKQLQCSSDAVDANQIVAAGLGSEVVTRGFYVLKICFDLLFTHIFSWESRPSGRRYGVQYAFVRWRMSRIGQIVGIEVDGEKDRRLRGLLQDRPTVVKSLLPVESARIIMCESVSIRIGVEI